MAPEILYGNPYSNQADVWSMGVIFYFMAYGSFPYEENSIPKLINKI